MSTKTVVAVIVFTAMLQAPRITVASQNQGNQAYTTTHGIPEYRIGPEDELRIRIWTGVEALDYEVVVQADGNIFLPFVGLASIQAGNRSALELRDRIVERLRESYRAPAAEVIVTEKLARLVTLLGEVRTTVRGQTGPGRYPLPGQIRLVDFLTEHGGPTDQADLNRTQITRGDQTAVYNLSRAIFQNDASQNPILDADDLIYLPAISTNSRKLLVFGEVAKPGLLTMTDDIPISEALALSGGFTRNAHKSGVVVVRGGLENPIVLNSNWELLQEGDLTQDLMMQDGDMIFVGRRKLATFTEVMQAFALPLSAIYTTILISNSTDNN
jgi:polysaccharide export outer membrane protein